MRILILSYFLFVLHLVIYASDMPVAYARTLDDVLLYTNELQLTQDSLSNQSVLDTSVVIQYPDFELIINKDSLHLILNRILPAYQYVDSIRSDSVHIFEKMLTATIQHPYFVDWVFTRNGYKLQNEIEKQELINKIKSGNQVTIIKQADEVYVYELQNQQKLRKNTQLSFNDYVFINQDIKPRQISPSKQKVLPVYWTRGFQVGLHLSQHYISPNWYRGGESHLALITLGSAFYNYNNKTTIQWENKLDFKAGFNSSTADSIRFLQTNEDVFRLTSKFGYKAFTKFYYTGQTEFTTQLFNTYKVNTYDRITGAFSPIRLSVSGGLDYKESADFSIFFSPVSYKYIYVNDTTKHISVAQSIADKLGIDKGKKSLHEVGSLVRINYRYKLSNEIEFDTRTTIYTNYKGIEFDSEVNGNFKINRFLTTRLSVNPRYDSTFKLPNNDKARLQFRQILSFGFSYKFY